MLRRFNPSMVRYLLTPIVYASYDTGNSINSGSMYFVLGCVSPGRELPCGPSWSSRGGGGAVTVHDWVASTNTAWFPKWGVVWIRLGYFLGIRYVPHCIWELRSGACIILSSLDWIHGWMMSNFWIWMKSNCWMWMMNNCWMWVLNNECCVISWCLPMFSY